MITTLDKVNKKNGQRVWEIGIDIETKKYRPTSSVVGRDISNIQPCWNSYEECMKVCDTRNSLQYL